MTTLTYDEEIQVAAEQVMKDHADTFKKLAESEAQDNLRDLIYGKNSFQRIVSVEPHDDKAELFVEQPDGRITSIFVNNSHWILFNRQHSPKMKQLAGNQYYKYIMEYDDRQRWSEVLKSSSRKGYDLHVCRDPKEALMLKDGYTYFKGMKVEDVSVMSIDIETNTGLQHTSESKVLLISTTLRKKGKILRKLFSYDEYEYVGQMFTDFCGYVRANDPSILVGHNLFGYDLPFIQHCCELNKTQFNLGRDDSSVKFNNYTSHKRKDGSQSYDYTNARIYGREIVDTFFLSLDYDIQRNFPSYKLKEIIDYLGLERKGRQHYDASKIAKNYKDPVEWAKIKEYAKDDADDALALYDLMIPSFFYYTQSVPRSLQQVINTATGSQINSLMVRSYLQNGHSIALGSEAVPFEGAISFGVPGVHKNCFKIDCVSLYPSIMRQYKIYDPVKDPIGNFLKIVNYFTDERLKNKAKSKETGDIYFRDLEQAAKRIINSMYGFLGAPKLNYNSPINAANVTRHGRELLKKAILWATGKDYETK